MARKAFDKIMDGLTDAMAYAEGDKSRGKAHQVEVPTVDVRAARKTLGLSQDRFAEVFRISPSTLRKWEQGTRRPHGPARVLLRVIEKEPDAVRRALADASGSDGKEGAPARRKQRPRRATGHAAPRRRGNARAAPGD